MMPCWKTMQHLPNISIRWVGDTANLFYKGYSEDGTTWSPFYLWVICLNNRISVDIKSFHFLQKSSEPCDVPPGGTQRDTRQYTYNSLRTAALFHSHEMTTREKRELYENLHLLIVCLCHLTCVVSFAMTQIHSGTLRVLSWSLEESHITALGAILRDGILLILNKISTNSSCSDRYF